ncbi:membrane-associated protein, putative [Bodo saltans]|uniref:Membrane-associated protein, putative n=1 Tax=Bodo saltans TaxID=75058 RepID=A0A0S4JJL7_BODSA|nr:membrane-associated protein, putative [Bodo saltans]|eukprot:CUG88664.1 membrane-associated protein, putative [Bodo saltans]
MGTRRRVRLTAASAVVVCMALFLWSSGHAEFEVVAHADDGLVRTKPPRSLNDAHTSSSSSSSSNKHSTISASDNTCHNRDQQLRSTASSVDSIAQCHALGSTFVTQLAAYINRHDTCRSRLAAESSSERVLMYSCESDKAGHFCGGMGDRFRGMITVFMLALLSDRRFELFHPTPAPIEEFLEPNLYHYVPDVSSRSSREDISRIPVDQSLMRLQRHKKFLRTLDSADSNGIGVLRVQSNSAGADSYIHRYPRWAARKGELGLSSNCNISCYFGCLHRVLFRASGELLTKINPAMPEGKFISVQVRMGGSWAPGMRIAEPFRTPPAAVPHFVSMLQELKALGKSNRDLFPPSGDVSWMKDAQIFVSSDAPRLISEIAKALNTTVVKWIDGGFGHTDTLNLGDVKPAKYTKLSTKEIRENYALTMANHFILSQGSHMVMAQSGFGDTAFWRSRLTATCLFVDMTNLNLGWQHHLVYRGEGGSANAVRNRHVDLSKSPEPFYG